MTDVRLQRCRDLLGPAPRSWRDSETAGYLTSRPPHWISHEPPQSFPRQLLDAQPALCRDGRLVWGHIVQANRQLFATGPEDHPANLVYSLDPAMDHTPDRLAAVADALFALKGRPQRDRAHQTIADNLAAERDPTVRIPVPYALAKARHVYLTSVIVVRHHLPVDHLRHRLLPVLVDPERTTATMVLPSRYWPKTLVTPWLTPA